MGSSLPTNDENSILEAKNKEGGKMEEESHERRSTGHRRFVFIPLAIAMMVGGVAGITLVNTGQAASSGVISFPGDAATWVEEEEPTIETKKGEFEISLSEVINPFAVWNCIEYDPEYIEFVGDEYQPPSSGLVGATTHIFKFKALQQGKTEITFETEDGKESKICEVGIQED
jgi:hypothetical protein